MEIKTLEEIKKECEKCTGCELCKTRTNTVFGVGNPDLSGIPFVGAAGKLFDKYLTAVGISRDEVYIANILKCRPPKNRDPKPDEEDVCIEYLRGQVRAIKPKMIVCLGRIAAARLIKPDFKITQEPGIWFHRGQFEICAVYHPSALLRDPHKKDAMLADMLAIKEKLDLLNE